MITGFSIQSVFLRLVFFGLLLASFPVWGQRTDVKKKFEFKYRNFKKAGSTREGSFDLYIQTQPSPDAPGRLFERFDMFEVDMNEVNDRNAAEGYVMIQLKNFDVYKNHKIVVRDNWISPPPVLSKYSSNRDIEKLIEDDRSDIRFMYKITDNGSGKLELFLDCIHKDSAASTAQPNYSLPLNFDVKNFSHPACQAWSNAKNGNRDEWCAFLQKYKNAPASCLSEAQKALQDSEAAEYNQLKSASGTPEERLVKARKTLGWYARCTEYYGLHIGEVRQLIRQLEKDSADAKTKTGSSTKDKDKNKTERVSPECEKEWSKISGSDNTEALRAFIATYSSDPACEKAVQQAQQRLEQIEPMRCTVSQTGNLVRVQVDNAAQIHPKYLDISATDGLDISGAGFSNSGRLEVQLKEPGIYQIYVKDEKGRDTVLEFRNLFVADLVKKDDDYHVYISGAESPYKIQLIDLKTNKVAYAFRTTNDTVKIFKTMLQVKGLEGEYSVQVSARAQETPIIAQGGTVRLSKQSDYLKWIALSGGMLLGVSLLVYLLYAIWKARSQTSAGNVYSIRTK
ncbi:MAG: hypothetical protein IT260_08895 [Saprospiraceae bacterium]|nr:hypothetical protein [Saprospiraceae bacterium]